MKFTKFIIKLASMDDVGAKYHATSMDSNTSRRPFFEATQMAAQSQSSSFSCEDRYDSAVVV